MEKPIITTKELEYWDHNNVRRTYTISSMTVPQSWPTWMEPDFDGNPIIGGANV